MFSARSPPYPGIDTVTRRLKLLQYIDNLQSNASSKSAIFDAFFGDFKDF
jgi:hypothetical protein